MLKIDCAVSAATMEHDEHGSDDDMPLGLDSDGSASRFGKKRSRVWEEYTPVYINGVIQSAECRYCHTLMSCKGAEGRSNGTSHLWRHHKTCRGKEGVDPNELQDAYIPYCMFIFFLSCVVLLVPSSCFFHASVHMLVI
jgi:hypothetical protein